MNHNDMMKAMIIPTKGARSMNEAVRRMTSLFTASKPPAAIPAPANPPINVCDDEEGIPNHQVSKFQAMAAMSPLNTTVNIRVDSMASGSTVFATVFATP